MNKKIIENVFYHGNDHPIHKFSEYSPSFFTEDYNYAQGYGNHIYAYRIKSEKPFDPSVDEHARLYYNDFFLKDELGKEAKPINQGEHISFIDADNFWAFMSVEEQLGKGFGYDSIIVREFLGDSYQTDFSIVPFELSQIEKLKTADFELNPKNSALNEAEADKLFELIGVHTHGNCHALSMYLAKEGLGQLMVVKPVDGSEIIHSFVLSKNNMSIDGGGVLSIYEMLQRYRSCAVDGEVSNFKIESIKVSELLNHSSVNKNDMLRAKKFWNMAIKGYETEIKEALHIDLDQPVMKLNRSNEIQFP